MTVSSPPTPRMPPRLPPRPVSKFTISTGQSDSQFRAGIYGAEGVGKTSLAGLCQGVKIVNIENSKRNPAYSYVNGVSVIGDGAASWANLRAFIQSLSSGIWCLDTMTRAEDWCAEWVIKNKKSNEGAKAADSLEDFKYKAGLTFITDEFRRLIADIDCAYLRGASFILVAHNRVSRIKNPDGSDFIRHEPRLIDDPKASNMLQFVQFLDHLLFIDLDKNIDKGKVQGSGSRTIYLDTAPSRLSKTRSLPRDPMPFNEGETELWKLLGVAGG